MQQLDFKLSVAGHPSLFCSKARDFDVFFSIPATGINSKTGILLLLSGFGGHAESNVYKKMRRVLAEKYNLVTLQSNYMGWEFMQGQQGFGLEIPKANYDKIVQVLNDEDRKLLFESKSIDITLNTISKYKIELPVNVKLTETKENLADMGPVQAIDNLTALLVVLEILEKNDYHINLGKIIAYGHSHGAYLAHLCNIFSGGLITDIVDNSGWISPAYLEGQRYLITSLNNAKLVLIFQYLIKDLVFDKSFWNLEFLYKQKQNRSKIFAFHGVNDNLISLSDKRQFTKLLRGEFYAVDTDVVNQSNGIFSSTSHGLGADFIKMFDVFMNNRLFSSKKEIQLTNQSFEFTQGRCIIDFANYVPIFEVEVSGRIQ